MSNKSLISVVLTTSVFLIFLVHNRHLLRPAEAAGGVGDLDPTFGQSGKVTALFFGNTAVAFAGALQPDGKIIAAGTNSTIQGFSLARFNTNGTLDNTFGEAGKVATTFSPGVDFAFVQSLALQSDQKIVAVGILINSDGSRDFGLVRYLPDGQLDATFGNSGKVRTTLSGARDEATAVAIQPDGRIIVAGRADEEFALVRYNTDGTLDNSFGSSGKTMIDFDGFEDAAHALALQSDGKILIAGQVIFRAPGAASLRQRFGVARCNSDGTIDSTFGTSGKVITSFNNNEFLDNQAFSMVVQSDGKPVVGGWTTGPQGGRDFALVRYNTDGSLDSTFGSQGRVTTDFANLGNDTIEALTIQPDGKIIAVGYTDLRIENDSFALARYNPNGTLDSSFGVGGKTTTKFFFDVFDSQAFAVLLQPNGNIVAVGHARGHFTLARYLGDAAVSPTPTPTPSPTPPPSPTPTPATLRLFLAESPPTPNQVATIDSVLFLGEPFEVFPQLKLLKPAIDPNTRVIVFVENLQLLPGETASSVIVSLTSILQTFEIPAEDVRLVRGADFAQVTFRLPDELGDGDWDITVKAQGQVTNSGVLRIR